MVNVLRASHDAVEPMFRLIKDGGLKADNSALATFTNARIAAASELHDLIASAWQASGTATATAGYPPVPVRGIEAALAKTSTRCCMARGRSRHG